MADGTIQVPPDNIGKKVDTSELTVGGATVERQRVVLADPTGATALAPVSATDGLLVNLGANNDVTVTSGALSATQGTSPWVVGQATGTNLHTVVDSGTVSATQGTSPWVVSQSTAASLKATVSQGTSPWTTSYTDGPNLDAFSRLRVANPVTQFDSTHLYGLDPLKWETAVVGGGTVVAVANQSAARLSTGGTTDTHSAILQTRETFQYQPGKSRLLEMTFALSAAQTNANAEIGYGNANDGIFFQRFGSTLQFDLRSSTSGSADDTRTVTQANWNLDKLDGTGASGITLDPTKTQILFIDLQYLGVGRVRAGFYISGAIVYAHQFLNANVQTTAYMSTGSLPLRARVWNAGTAGGTVTMDQICSTVVSEGGIESERLNHLSVSNQASAISTSVTPAPIIAIRVGTTLNSVTYRGCVYPREIEISVASGNHFYQVIRGATVTGGSWAAVNATNSAVEVNLTATGFSGGVVVAEGWASATGSTRTNDSATDFNQNPLVYSSLNNVQDTFLVVARTLTSTGTALAAIHWEETR